MFLPYFYRPLVPRRNLKTKFFDEKIVAMNVTMFLG